MSSTDKSAAFLGAILESFLEEKYTLGGSRSNNNSAGGMWSGPGDWIVRDTRVTGVHKAHITTAERATAQAIGKTAGNLADYGVMAVGAYKLYSAIANDMNNKGGSMEETTKAATSVAGGYVGAKCGAYVGSTVGGLLGMVGGSAGSNALGALGSMVGEVFGAYAGSEFAEDTYDTLSESQSVEVSRN